VLVGSVVNAKMSSVQQQLFEAASRDDVALLEKISKKTSLNLKNQSNETPFIVAVAADSKQVIEFLLEKKVDINAKDKSGQSALFYAVSNRNFILANKLITMGAKLSGRNKQGESIIFEASRAGEADLIEKIHKIDPEQIKGLNSDGESVAFVALRSGQYKVFEKLFELYPGLKNIKNKKGITLLEFAKEEQIPLQNPVYKLLQ
jgi:ankyrin repeat protein